MSTDHDDRLRLVLYSQIASLLGSWSVGACEFSSSSLINFPAFQLSTVMFALLSWIGFSITGKFAKTEIAQMKPKEKMSPEIKGDGETLMDAVCSSSSTSPSPLLAFFQQTLEILRQSNFLAFVFANFLQIFHVTFYSNFASIFLDILFLCLSPWLKARGAFWVVSRSFIGKVLVAAVLSLCINFSLLSPAHFRVALLFFIGADFACGSAIFATFNLLVSDIIDDDMRLNKRSSPLSSSVFGTNA